MWVVICRVGLLYGDGDSVGKGVCVWRVFFLMIRRPPRSTQSRSSAASDVYKRQGGDHVPHHHADVPPGAPLHPVFPGRGQAGAL